MTAMGIIDKLLGKKPTTATNLEAEIAAQAAAIETARAKIATAQAARKTAIDELDAAGHKAADDEIAEGGREIERRANAIEKLETARAERLDLDKREAFRRDDADLAAKGVALEGRIAAEYPAACKSIVAMLDDITAFRDQHLALRERATALGETSAVRDPEDSRGAVAATMRGATCRPDALEKAIGNLPALVVGDAPFPTGEARFWPRASA